MKKKIKVVKVVNIEQQNNLKVVTVEEEEISTPSWYNFWDDKKVFAFWTKYVTTCGLMWFRYPSMDRVNCWRYREELADAFEQFELCCKFGVNEYGERNE